MPRLGQIKSNSIIALYNRLGCKMELLTEEQRNELRAYWREHSVGRKRPPYNPMKAHEIYVRRTRKKLLEQWK